MYIESLLKSFKVKQRKKSAPRRCKHCMLAVVRRSQKKFAPPQTPSLGAWDGQNLISWRWSLPLPTNPIWWGSMHAISSYHITDPQTHTRKQTDRTDYNTLRHSFASIHCLLWNVWWQYIHFTWHLTNFAYASSAASCISNGGLTMSISHRLKRTGHQ